jgi:hypothetical protein
LRSRTKSAPRATRSVEIANTRANHRGEIPEISLPLIEIYINDMIAAEVETSIALFEIHPSGTPTCNRAPPPRMIARLVRIDSVGTPPEFERRWPNRIGVTTGARNRDVIDAAVENWTSPSDSRVHTIALPAVVGEHDREPGSRSPGEEEIDDVHPEYWQDAVREE